MGTTYTQLSITERRRIERWRHAKVPVDEMARVLRPSKTCPIKHAVQSPLIVDQSS